MTTPTTAGGAVLPVVAKVSDLILLIRERVMVDFGAVNQEWLVLRSDAQAEIDALRAELAALKAAQDDQARGEWSGRIIEINYETQRAVVRYEGDHPGLGVIVRVDECASRSAIAATKETP